MAFDFRIVRVTIQDGDNIDVFEKLAITIVGQRTLSFIANEATITLINLDEATRTRIATKFSNPNLFRNTGQRALITIEIGRQSTGTFVLFKGDLTTVTITNPPDIALSLNVISRYYDKTVIESRNFGESQSLKAIAQNIADQLGLDLIFEPEDKQIANAYFEGDVLKQIKMLADMGNIEAAIDNDQLLVLKANEPRRTSGDPVLIDVNNGLIGVPNFKEYGIQFRMLADPRISLGEEVRVISIINPSVNDSLFKVVNILFSIANRDTPFYYDVYGVRTS